MTITVQENADRHRYEAIDESGVVAGYAEYVDHRGSRLLFHTVVEDAFEGQGIGSALARGALDQAIAAGPVQVSCEFIKAWLERHPEYLEKVTLR